LPDFLKKKQTLEKPRCLNQDQAFNKTIHVDMIDTPTNLSEVSGKTILSITDDTRTFTQVTVIADSGIDSMASAIWNYWCQPYGPPETILFNQGKVRTSKLESRINELIPLEQRISCRSRKDTFNQEIQQQWWQNQNEISAEEFAHNLNFLCNLQSPAKTRTGYTDQGHFDGNHQDLTDVEDFTEDETDPEEEHEKLPLINHKRKQISLCWHKLQGPAYNQFRCRRLATEWQWRLPEVKEVDEDHEWAQLKQMEDMIERHKQELLKHGVPELADENEAWGEHQGPEDDRVHEEDDSWEDGDLTYITAILESFSRPKSNSEQPSASNYTMFPPEGAQTRAQAWPTLPPKFNQNFNQKLTIYNYNERNFSCSSNFEEEGTKELADYFSDKEDDSLDNEDPTSESDTWSEFETNKFGLDTINKVNYEEPGEQINIKGISSLSEETALAFLAWQLYIPPEPVFQNLSAQSWRWPFHSRRPYHRSLPSSRFQRSWVLSQQPDQL
jgi:hypothetical protein